MAATYTELDWAVFIAYGLLLFLSAWWLNRSIPHNSKDYFLGGNNMPVWMVAISVLATSQSAATFLGGPDMGYRGDLSYLATNIGALIAAFFVASYLIPKFYQYKVFTVYELLEQKIGTKAKKYAGLMYLLGRVFASGARLYMAGIAVAMILFANIDANSVVIAIAIITLAGLLFSVFGGIRLVIYSDVIQAAVYVSAALFVIYFLYSAIPANFSQIIAVLQHPSVTESSKLAVFKFDLDFTGAGVFNFWSIITGFVLLNIAAFGLDQDMTQRVLTCKNAQAGSKAMLLSIIMVIPVMLLFLLIGLLLYVFYQRPDLMFSEDAVQAIKTFDGEKVTIFMAYVLNEIPSGVRGLVTIGIIAAALSTLNSGLSSMSSVIVQDIYRPFLESKEFEAKEHEGKAFGVKNKSRQKIIADRHYVNAGKIAMLFVAIILAGMAVLSYYWQQYSDMPLLTFALSVMLFSYSGLLGVYFTALFTKRGSDSSVLAALIVGFISTLIMQPYVQSLYLSNEYQFDLAFTWKLCIASAISTLVCLSGKKLDINENNKSEAVT
jgi:solute:Na+ symporter, SSS family